MNRIARAAVLLCATCAPTIDAQWTIQDSQTTADLRGIHYLGNGIAWASGTEGTVLRTTDDGKDWQRCATPPDADHLDFRGVQAFDGETAIVMSSGKGPLSRLYKTTDACRTWKLVATNPDENGFWDAVTLNSEFGESASQAYILGDSVQGELKVWEWKEGWEERELEPSYEATGKAERDEGSFAASNSVFQLVGTPQVDPIWKFHLRWTAGTAEHSYMYIVRNESTKSCEPCVQEHLKVVIPMAQSSQTAGVFSFAFRTELAGLSVGGDFKKPNNRIKVACWTNDGGLNWNASTTQPHGFRSAVAYHAAAKSWITVGPNGTDISTDDGRNWRPLRPRPGDPPDADQHWNALSLPFVVGPHGRIGKLEAQALAH